MNKSEIVWRERTSALKSIASVWTCNASDITSRTVLADPCTSIIFVKSPSSAELILRGPETKPRIETLLPGYTWIGIRLQPGVQVKNFSVGQFTDDFVTLQASNEAWFELGGARLQFSGFNNAELLIKQMEAANLISIADVDGKKNPKQGLSSKSQSRLVKRTTGLSPYKLHQLQRIHEALSLLKQGMSVSTVVSELGFADQAHLTRAAKQFLGHTPKELLQLPQKP